MGGGGGGSLVLSILQRLTVQFGEGSNIHLKCLVIRTIDENNCHLLIIDKK